MPKRSQEHLDARRAQILAGAQRAFARHGYAGATVTRLEEEIGLSRGAIFNYFPSKQDLFIALSADINRRYAELLTTGGAEAALRAMAAEDPVWIGVVFEMQAQLRHDPDFVRKLDEIYEEEGPAFHDLLVQAQKDGTYRDDVPARDLGRFVSMVVNGLALRVLTGDETDIDVLVRLVNDAVAPRE